MGPGRSWIVAGVLGLAACNGSGSANSTTIVVPGPPTPRAEPSQLVQQQPNINHVHALAAGPGGAILIATHHGVELVAAGTSSPQAIAAPGLRGDVLQVLIDAGGTAYASGHNLGVQVSRDGGHTWAPAAPEVAGLDVHGLAVDPHDARNLFAYAVGKGMLVSSDGGAHWTHRPGYADQTYLTGLVVTADGTLLAGSPALGILASTDHGGNFIAVRAGTGAVYSLAASASDPNIVLAATETGVFLTQNGGKDWSIGVTSDPITGVAVDPRNPSRFYAGAADGQLFASGDAGQSWKAL